MPGNNNHSSLDQNGKFHPFGIVQRYSCTRHRTPRCALSLMYLVFLSGAGTLLTSLIQSLLHKYIPRHRQPCWRDCPDSTNKVTYSCQNKKSVPFPSLQNARLGIILEYFSKWLEDLDGVAFLTTLFDCASLLKEVFGVCHVVLPCSIPVTSVIPSALKDLLSVIFFRFMH